MEILKNNWKDFAWIWSRLTQYVKSDLLQKFRLNSKTTKVLKVHGSYDQNHPSLFKIPLVNSIGNLISEFFNFDPNFQNKQPKHYSSHEKMLKGVIWHRSEKLYEIHYISYSINNIFKFLNLSS